MSNLEFTESMRDVFEKYEFYNQPEKTFNFDMDLIEKMYTAIITLENGEDVVLTANELHNLVVAKTGINYEFVSFRLLMNHNAFHQEMTKRASYLLT